MAKRKNELNAENPTQETKYSKGQILSSKRFKNNMDLINALLKDGEKYTINDVDKIIERFKKTEVK